MNVFPLCATSTHLSTVSPLPPKKTILLPSSTVKMSWPGSKSSGMVSVGPVAKEVGSRRRSCRCLARECPAARKRPWKEARVAGLRGMKSWGVV